MYCLSFNSAGNRLCCSSDTSESALPRCSNHRLTRHQAPSTFFRSTMVARRRRLLRPAPSQTQHRRWACLRACCPSISPQNGRSRNGSATVQKLLLRFRRSGRTAYTFSPLPARFQSCLLTRHQVNPRVVCMRCALLPPVLPARCLAARWLTLCSHTPP